MKGIFACSEEILALPMGVPWKAAGRNAELQLFTPPCVSVGQTVMNPGSDWFSVPRPYVIHDPMLGRTNVSEPVCSSSSAPPCRELEANMELITHRSSMHAPTCGNNSLTSMPLRPRC